MTLAVPGLSLVPAEPQGGCTGPLRSCAHLQDGQRGQAWVLSPPWCGGNRVRPTPPTSTQAGWGHESVKDLPCQLQDSVSWTCFQTVVLLPSLVASQAIDSICDTAGSGQLSICLSVCPSIHHVYIFLIYMRINV